MAYHQKHSKRPKGPPFSQIPYEILESPAYKAMKYSTRAAFPYFRRKVHIGYENSGYYRATIEYTYTEAKKYGFTHPTHSANIKDLVAHGFLDPVERGTRRCQDGLYNASKFRLSQRWRAWDTFEFKEVRWEGFMSERMWGAQIPSKESLRVQVKKVYLETDGEMSPGKETLLGEKRPQMYAAQAQEAGLPDEEMF